MSTTTITPVGEPTYEELKERLAEILKTQGNKATGGLKVSEKGAVSVYGLGKFPVTLYGEQWKRVAKMIPEILSFIEDNESRLAHKPAPKDKSFELDKGMQRKAQIQLNTMRSVAATRELTDEEQDALSRLEVLLEA
jgi:hypothetical protein